MSATAIIGMVLYVLAILFGSIKVDGVKIGYPWRPIFMIFLFPLVGVILTIVGLVGIVILEPFMYFFGSHWFIISNF